MDFILPTASSAAPGADETPALDRRLGPLSEMLELDRSECLQLVAESSFGRLAVNIGDGPPLIRPVNFVFDDRSQSVVFRTGPGSKFHALLMSANAAFEVDSTDLTGHAGWSVVILGVTEEITNKSDLGHLGGLGLDPGAPGPKSHWFRLRARTVSGRRILVTPDGPHV